MPKLWEAHLAASFPAGCRGRDVDGIDLVMLDADTAGCLENYFGTGRLLTIGHAAILGRCYHDLGIVTRGLSEPERSYFQRLETLASEVLQEVSQNRFEA